jgi:hypothetical protein
MAENIPQSGDGYKCSCGFITDNKLKFLRHIKDGKEGRLEGGLNVVHGSEGRVNILTGEITMPSYNKRTPEQKKESQHASKGKKDLQTIKTTDILANASEIRFVPRIYTCTYTAIMQAAQDAAVKFFGWRKDMPFENFIDTVAYLFFKEHGITLGGYLVEDSLLSTKTEEEKEEKEEPVTVNTEE